MTAPPVTSESKMKFGIYVPAPVFRAIEELQLAGRQFSRSALIVDAIIEKADRDLPKNWRETVGYETEESAA